MIVSARTLYLGLAVIALAGCSGGGSSGGGAASTAAGSTGTGTPGTGSTTGPLRPAYSMQSVTPASLARQQQAMLLYNSELQALWDRLRPEVNQRLRNELDALVQSGTLGYQPTSNITLGITQISGMTFDAPIAPGFDQLTTTDLVMALPHQGEWFLKVDALAGVQVQIAGFPLNLGFPISLEVRLAARVDLDLDDSDPTRPKILRAAPPQTTLAVAVTSPDPNAQQYLGYFNQVAQPLVQAAVNVALSALVTPALPGFPGAVWADGTPPLADSGAATPFEEVAVNVGRKIRRDHCPHGLLHRIRMDTSLDDESWLTAYRNGGSGNQGTVVGISGESDSAMNSAYFLSAQAWRHAATGSSEAMDNVAWLLRGIGTLVDVNGTGLMARSAAPLNSMLGQHIDGRGAPGAFAYTQLYGETWVGWQGHKGNSRDQYTAVFFGLANTHEAMSEPAVRGECELRIQQLLDYLIANDWVVSIDRPNWTQAGNPAAPLIFRGQAVYQQLSFLTIGEHMHPGRYSAELQRLGPLASMTWLGAWIGVNSVDSYYRFNLQLLNAYNYFRLEQDQQRWMEMARGYRITQRWLGHHQNPHVDLIQCAIDPSLETALFPQIREQLRQFLERNHRGVAPPGLDFSAVQWQTFPFASLTSTSGNPQNVPTAPLPVPLRKYTGYYQWQKQPTRPAARPTDPQVVTSHAQSEKPGTDYVMPYWWGRYYGAF